MDGIIRRKTNQSPNFSLTKHSGHRQAGRKTPSERYSPAVWVVGKKFRYHQCRRRIVSLQMLSATTSPATDCHGGPLLNCTYYKPSTGVHHGDLPGIRFVLNPEIQLDQINSSETFPNIENRKSHGGMDCDFCRPGNLVRWNPARLNMTQLYILLARPFQ